MTKSTLTHAGGLVVRNLRSDPQILIIRPSDGTDAWVLPKGHIRPLEAPEAAAAREVAEEAGVVARVGRLIDSVSFRVKGEQVHVGFYLMEFERETTPAEQRGVRWVSPSEAERSLTHSDSLRILHAVFPPQG